uniref:Hsc70-interacting protein n=1 Tax=Schistocephalus solidus TaxID=70667 RepID=A0A0X3PSS8_SCHSO
MSCGMFPPEALKQAKDFIAVLKQNPDLLHSPELVFLKDYLVSMGANIPKKGKDTAQTFESSSDEEASPVEEEAPESEESELEFDKTDVLPPESNELPPMGDDSVEVTEEMADKASEKRSEAQAKFADGDFEAAAALFTESIIANPHLSMCFAKRAACYVKLQRPMAAIRDCDKAIELNPDSALPYKWRGLANKLLGNWELAYLDLQTSLKLDYTDDANAAIKELEPKYKRIHEHKLKYERKLEEKKYAELKKAREARQRAYEKAKKEEAKARAQEQHFGMPSGMPGQMPPGMENIFGSLFSDPEMMAAMQDPEIQAAFSEGVSNPAAFAKAAKNPKFANLMKKMQENMKGSGESTFVPPGGHMPPTSSAGDDLD